MKKSNTSKAQQLARQNYRHAFIPSLVIVVGLIIVVMPFHATLTVWASQLLGHYTALRLWKECLLILLGFGAVYILLTHADIRRQFLSSRLTWLIAAFLAVQVLWGMVALFMHQVTVAALGYGWVSDTRYLVFFLLASILAPLAPKIYATWPKLVFWPAAVVIAFGITQYFLLPYDFLTHLGYSAATIFPYEDINHNTHYIRIMSSLRGANPLGAYMVMVLSLLAAAVLKHRTWRRAWASERRVQTLFIGLLALSGVLALVLTFSRSAWIGLLFSLVAVIWASLGGKARRVLLTGALVCAIAAAGAILLFREDTTFQNVFLHTQTNSAIAATSNEGHVSALQDGLNDVLREPLGRGPGTAGPASAYNAGHQGRIAENYFIQIAQETGWIGLALFVAINIVLAKELWVRCSDPLALGLLAGLAGISVIGLFGHVWADDTLAYIWWGLTGMLCSRRTPDPGNNRVA